MVLITLDTTQLDLGLPYATRSPVPLFDHATQPNAGTACAPHPKPHFRRARVPHTGETGMLTTRSFGPLFREALL